MRAVEPEGGGDRGRGRPVERGGAPLEIHEHAPHDLAQVVAGDHLLEALRARRRLVELAVERGVVRRFDGSDPVEVPRLEVADARRPQVRGEVGAGAEDQADVGRAPGAVTAARPVGL